jgi:molybdate transport system substrate-binding protein
MPTVRNLTTLPGDQGIVSRASARIPLLIALAGTVILVSVAGIVRIKPAPKHLVRVAAAADLQFAMRDVLAAFKSHHPDVEVTVTNGSSGIFFAQLENQAPFDVFLSADMDYPRRLIDEGLARPESAFQYAVGHLVLWVPNQSPIDVEKLGIQAVLDPSVRKVVIANPNHAPYGRAAEAALRSSGMYDRIKDRLVLGDNIAQTAQFIDSGAAEIGLIALSLALAPELRERGRYWELPLDAYPRLEQGGVILNWAEDLESANLLCTFLKEPEGKEILHRYGFMLP